MKDHYFFKKNRTLNSYEYYDQEVKQIYITSNMPVMKKEKHFNKNHDFNEYNDRYSPVIFNGFVSVEDINTALNCKSLKLIQFANMQQPMKPLTIRGELDQWIEKLLMTMSFKSV